MERRREDRSSRDQLSSLGVRVVPATGDGRGARRRNAHAEQALAMADFTSAQSQLAAARAAQNAAQLAASQAAARARQAEDALDATRRQVSPQDDSGRIAQLTAALRRAAEQQAAAQ